MPNRSGKLVIHHKQVVSSNLKSVGYSSAEKILEVTFKSGNTYRYYQVPPIVYERLVKAKSQGKYFHRAVRHEYRYKRVKSAYRMGRAYRMVEREMLYGEIRVVARGRR